MPPSTSFLDAVAERVSRGDALSADDATQVFQTNNLIVVGTLADEVRRRLHGSRTTFVRVLEVHIGAVPPTLPAGMQYGELRLVGEPQHLDAAVHAVAAARALQPAAPLTAFSLDHLAGLASASRPIDAVLRDLRAAGLDGIAEVPLDGLPGVAEHVERARAAGLRVMRLTAHSIGEGQQVGSACAARDLQSTVGGFRVFAPLPRTVSVARPTTGYDDVKQVAVARLVATTIPSIQVDWPLYGPKLAQVALTVGADDVDGVAADAGTLGPRRSPLEEIRGNIRAASQEPVERDAFFETSGG